MYPPSIPMCAWSRCIIRRRLGWGKRHLFNAGYHDSVPFSRAVSVHSPYVVQDCQQYGPRVAMLLIGRPKVLRGPEQPQTDMLSWLVWLPLPDEWSEGDLAECSSAGDGLSRMSVYLSALTEGWGLCRHLGSGVCVCLGVFKWDVSSAVLLAM